MTCACGSVEWFVDEWSVGLSLNHSSLKIAKLMLDITYLKCRHHKQGLGTGIFMNEV